MNSNFNTNNRKQNRIQKKYLQKFIIEIIYLHSIEKNNKSCKNDKQNRFCATNVYIIIENMMHECLIRINLLNV